MTHQTTYDRLRQAASPELVRRLQAALAPVDRMSERLERLVFSTADPATPAGKDRLDPLASRGYDLAHAYLRASLDHVWTWRTLLNAGVIPMYAHLSLLRTAHESALAALWLAEQGLDQNERRIRAVAAQLDDYDERRKVEEAGGDFTPDPAGTGKTAQQRITGLMDEAETAGLTRLNKKNERILNAAMPSAVDLFDRYEQVGPKSKGSFVYRVESGLAHAKQWALFIGAKQAGEFDDAGRAPALAMTDDTLTLAITIRAMRSIERALSALESRYRPQDPST